MTPLKFDRVAHLASVSPFGGWGQCGGGEASRCGLLVHSVDDADRVAALAGALFGMVVKVSREASGLWLASAPWVA